MVAVQRRRKNTGKPSRSMLPRIVLGLVGIYGVFVFISSSRQSSEISTGDVNKVKPVSLLDALESSKQKLEKPGQQSSLRKNSQLSSNPGASDSIHVIGQPVKNPPNLDQHVDPHPANDNVKSDEDEDLNEGKVPDTPQESDINGVKEPDIPHEIDLDEGIAPDIPQESDFNNDDNTDAHQPLPNINNNNTPQLGSLNDQKALAREGSGPTNVAYLKHFDDERQHPQFRNNKADLSTSQQTMAAKASSQTGETGLKPCLTVSVNGKHFLQDQACHDGDKPLVVFNSAPFSRTWCGHTIEPNAALKLDSECNEPVVRVLSEDLPAIDGRGMQSIIVKSHDGEITPDDVESVECNIPCQQERGMEGVLRFIDGEPSWSITKTMDDSWRSSVTKIERTAFRRNQFYSTQSWLSSVPMTHFTFDKFSLRNRPAVDWESAQKKAVYLVQTECQGGSRRSKYVAAMRKVFPLDSMGNCQHTVDTPPGENIFDQEGRINIMKNYQFVLAFDYMTENDHISDHIWESLMSGSLPVFVGASNARDHLPPNSVIFAGDHSNWDDLATYVQRVSDDKELWESYHAWRNDESALQAFEDKYYFTRTSPECRLCRWAYAKRNGLGWDHQSQEVKSPKLPRHLCTTEKDMVTRPFIEEWSMQGGASVKAIPGEAESCATTTADGIISSDTFDVHRTLIQHDGGIIDVELSAVHQRSSAGDIVLKLRFPSVHNQDGAYFANIHTLVGSNYGSIITSALIQDEYVKVTVLANWETSISSPEEGSIEIKVKQGDETIEANEIRRLRIITEDMSALHDKMTEGFPSSFAKMMMQDFMEPLAVFYVDSSVNYFEMEQE